MKTLNLVQGSPEWHAHRAQYLNASEAPSVMGVSPYVSRSDLLRMKATGAEREVNSFTQSVFDRGHEVEPLARVIAEKIIGDELFPATGREDDGKLSASFDGITLLEEVIWEGKQWNEDKARRVRAGELPIEDKWQVVQQLAISRATKCLYTVSDGTEERTVHMWVTLDPADEAALRAGWALFEQDLAAYTPPPEAAVVVGSAPETLPMLFANVKGEVTGTNLVAFRAKATEILSAIRTDLQTDEDFATAEATTKWCKEVEERLEGVKQNVLGQTITIDELFRTIDELKEQARAKRLLLEKSVTSRKQAIREEILADGKTRYETHVKTLNDGLPHRVLAPSNIPVTDFAGVMKGKKSIKSLRDAVDQEVTRLKLEVNALTEKVRSNFKRLDDLSAGFETLFADRGQLVFKAPDDLEAVVKGRITEHKSAEERKQLAAAAAAAPTQPVPTAPVAAVAAAPIPAAAAPSQIAAAPAPAQSATLEADLDTWKKKHKVTPSAYNGLLAVLRDHHIISSEAA
ncbi:MAG TPA: YqaJ viral recombinase family protein [Gammaproteobacteria bacterium]